MLNSLKFRFIIFLEGKLDWKLMTSTGGMPSFTFGCSYIIDHCNRLRRGTRLTYVCGFCHLCRHRYVRCDGNGYQAGQQALIINQMRVDFQTFVQEAKGWQQKDGQQKILELKTLLGHKPNEVFAWCCNREYNLSYYLFVHRLKTKKGVFKHNRLNTPCFHMY